MKEMRDERDEMTRGAGIFLSRGTDTMFLINGFMDCRAKETNNKSRASFRELSK